MRIATVDLETFWAQEHSLSKMSPIAYCTHPETEIISIGVKFGEGNTDILFGEDHIKATMAKLDWSDTMVVGHNLSGFDCMILSWRLGIKPKMWGCTLAMARPLHAKTTGLSLAKLVEHYVLGVKDQSALIATKGRHLKDFTAQEITEMGRYNKADVEQCYALFKKLLPHYSRKELWHIDTTIRMLVEPKFKVDTTLLDTTLLAERNRKNLAVLNLAELLDIDIQGDTGAIEEQVTAQLASVAKFSAILDGQGVPVPTKKSPSNPDTQIPALAKTDQEFLDMQEHGNPIVAAAAQARLAIKSTILETRIQAFLDASAATGGHLPVPLNYCGADTTGRWSGWAYNPQNLPRVAKKSKLSDALRNCMQAGPGKTIIVADLSGIELRVNHVLWKVPSTMELYQGNAKADLYRAAGAIVHGCTPEEVTDAQRQIEKIKALGLGFGAGAKTFVRIAKIMGGMDITEDQAQEWVTSWRTQYSEIVRGWKTCGTSIQDIYDGTSNTIDPWGMCVTTEQGVRLPSGRVIRYPGLRVEEGGTWDDGRAKRSWVYGTGRHKAFLTGPKMDENLVQALARDVLADNTLAFFKLTGLRPQLSVHDELVYVVSEAAADDLLPMLQGIMRTPPKWWPELITWSEGGKATTYGATKG